MCKFLKFLVGFVVGVLAGGVTALLLAPKTGFELRRDIQTDVEAWIRDAELAVSGSYILLEPPSKDKTGV